MAKIIGFGNRKGGTGKTSTANAFACFLAYSGRFNGLKIAGIDLDPMMSWADMRDDDIDDFELLLEEGKLTKEQMKAKEDKMFDLFAEPVATFPSKLDQYDKDYDILLLDLPGTLDQEGVPEMYSYVDIIVVPTDLTRQDVNGTIDFVNKLVEDVFPIRKKAQLPIQPVIGVLTKIDKNTAAFRERKEDLEENGLKNEFGFEFIKEPITQSKAVFGQYANTHDVLKNGTGQVVFTEVFDELATKLGIVNTEKITA